MLNKAPAPKMPVVKPVKSVDELMPMARYMVSHDPPNMYDGIEVKKGQRVLLVTDQTADRMVFEAFSAAFKERGTHVTVIDLEGFVGLKDAGELVDNTFSNAWYPGWVWEAANEADVVLLMAFLKPPHTPLPKLPNKPVIDNLELTADLMISEHNSYPVEIRDTIDGILWEKIANCKKIRWTDLEGTDLELNLTDKDWNRLTERFIKRQGLPYMHGHLQLPAPSTGINGVYVTSSITFGGPIPRMRLTIEKGKIVKVAGGGVFGDRLKESFEKHSGLASPACPGPGINWLTTIGICTNPKARRSPFFGELSGSARICAWTYGHRRAGVFHTSVGEGYISETHKLIRHMDTFFNTLMTEKGTAIENGQILAMEDKNVRKVAAKYGDPDKLLEEIWIPSVSGVNAP